MKKPALGTAMVLLTFLIISPASADSILQIWSCKLHDGKSQADAEAVSAAWLKAAKTMEGGKDLKVYHDYPIAANAGDGEFAFVMVANDAKTWGLFNNNYDESPAAKADEEWTKVASCSRSAIWASVEIT